MNMRIEGWVLSLNLFMRDEDKAQGAWSLGGCKPFNSEAGNKLFQCMQQTYHVTRKHAQKERFTWDHLQ